MIKPFVDAFMSNKKNLRSDLKKDPPRNYSALVTAVISTIQNAQGDSYLDDASPDAKRITVIDHGHYQGTLLFIIGETGYQPHKYWSVYVSYGSCSSCDTLQAIKSREYDLNYDNDTVTATITEKGLDDLMTMALHIVQNIKEIG